MNYNNFLSNSQMSFDYFMGQDFNPYEPFIPPFHLNFPDSSLREPEMEQDLLKLEVLNYENPEAGLGLTPEEEFAEADFDVKGLKDQAPELIKRINKEEEVTKENTITNAENINNDNSGFVEPKAKEDLGGIQIDKGQRFSKKNDKGRHSFSIPSDSCPTLMNWVLLGVTLFRFLEF